MKKYLTGLFTGIFIMVGLFTVMGASQIENDSLKAILGRLDAYLQEELSKDNQTGRFQLQSFQIERTHWHYMLDTATGELYRLEPSRTASNAKWILTAQANFEQ